MSLYNAIRAALEEISDKTIYKVLSRNEMKSVMTNAVGVGTPFIIRDLDTLQPYMLFTAWSDVDGTAREVWVAPINELLEVDLTKAKRIVTGADFGVDGLPTVHAFWDDYNEEWVLFSTTYPTGSDVAVTFCDKEFNVKDKQTLTIYKADGSTGEDLRDAGVSPIPLFNGKLLLTAGYRGNRGLWLIYYFTKRPLSTPSKVNALDTTDVRMVPTYFAMGLCVHQTIACDSGLVMFSALNDYRDLWYIQVYYGPEKDWDVAGNFSPFMWVTPVPPPFYVHFTDAIGNIGQPHYTTYLGKPLLFFMRAPTWNVGGSRKYAHEIWATVVDPSELLNPKGKTLVTSGEDEPYTIGKLPIPTFGADVAEIHLYNVSAAGTLTIIESNSPYHIWNETTSRITTDESISAGGNKIIWNKPAPYIALKTDVDMDAWMVVLR